MGRQGSRACLRTRRTVACLVLGVIGIAGAIVIAMAYVTAPTPPPRPAAALTLAPLTTGRQTSAPSTSAVSRTSSRKPLKVASSRSRSALQVRLVRSVPVRIDVPAIGVHAPTGSVGVDADGVLQVPPLSRPYLTAWYRLGVTPGEIGNAVIVGHVDSYASGPAVFYKLGDLNLGDSVDVTLKDGVVVVFRVDRVALYAKSNLPIGDIFGRSRYPGLRLITCGGAFDSTTHEYLSNVVAFASLSGSRAPTPSDTAPTRT